MARTIYENIGVEFVLEEIDEYEAKIKVNDKTLIYISREQEAEFEVWGIERSGFFNGREKWAKGFENQRV